MKILIVHNEYGKFRGEESVIQSQINLLQNNGHVVITFRRSSAELLQMRLGKIRTFFSGMYSFSSRRAARKLLSDQKPDIVHIHSLFPFISRSVLCECNKAGIPIVMTVYTYLNEPSQRLAELGFASREQPKEAIG